MRCLDFQNVTMRKLVFMFWIVSITSKISEGQLCLNEIRLTTIPIYPSWTLLFTFLAVHFQASLYIFFWSLKPRIYHCHEDFLPVEFSPTSMRSRVRVKYFPSRIFLYVSFMKVSSAATSPIFWDIFGANGSKYCFFDDLPAFAAFWLARRVACAARTKTITIKLLETPGEHV